MTLLERRESSASAQLRERLTHLSADHEIVTTVITYEEQTRGWMALFAKASRPAATIVAYRDLLDHLEMFKGISVVAYTNAADGFFQALRKRKLRVGTRDLRIAAICLSHGATLLT